MCTAKLSLEWKLTRVHAGSWDPVAACGGAANAHHIVGSSARLVVFYLLVHITRSFIEKITLPGTEYSVTGDWANFLWEPNKIKCNSMAENSALTFVASTLKAQGN